MARLFWLGLGAGLAVLIMRALRRFTAKLTPKAIAADLGMGLTELAASVGSFAAEVRSAMAERERELRSAAGLDAPTQFGSRHGRLG